MRSTHAHCKQATSTLLSDDFQCPLHPFPSINFASQVASHKGMVLDKELSPGHILCLWPPVQHHLLGTQTLWTNPAPAFTTCPKRDTQRKFLPSCFFALFFSKYEVINLQRLIRLLLEQLASQRTLQKAIGYTESWHVKVLFKKSFQHSYRLVMPK